MKIVIFQILFLIIQFLKNYDFTASFDYKINPKRNYLKNAKFSKDGSSGLLEKYQIIIVD